MISLKELKYVGSYPERAPYPGDDYAKETLENMKETFDKYNEKYRNKDYSIIFSDSSEINFEIFEYNVAHMLGIDYTNINGGNYEDFIKEVLKLDRTKGNVNSYNVVKSILDNYEEVIKYDGFTNTRALNYYKSRIKCAIFDKISDFEKFNFGKLETKDGTKLLFTSSNEAICPYFLVRLKLDGKYKKYCVNSLLAPEKNQIPYYFQEPASIPTQIIIDDNNQNLTKIEATPREKIEMLNMYKSIILNDSLENKMDISGDYMSILADMDIKQKRKTL